MSLHSRINETGLRRKERVSVALNKAQDKGVDHLIKTGDEKPFVAAGRKSIAADKKLARAQSQSRVRGDTRASRGLNAGKQTISNRFSALIAEAEKTAQQRTQQSFRIGTMMADQEHKDPTQAKKLKARRTKMKAAGHTNVSAGMADQSKKLRAKDKAK